MATKVTLNIYDLSPANDMLYPIGFGLHHSGVEILGVEYSFASGGGIFESSPKVAPGALFRESIELGAFDGGQQELQRALADLREDFGPDRYNLIRKNCNHFANALVWNLLGRQIPPHVNRLADVGVCCSCFLPKKLIDHAPVGDPTDTSGGGSSSSGFSRSGGPPSSSSSSQVKTFVGAGNKLGSNDSSSSSRWRGSGQSQRQDDLTDRREKARAAALARMEASKREQQSDGSDKSH